MPCRDWDDGPYYINRPETIDKLCEAYKLLEKNGLPIPANGKAWWTAHKREDALRKAELQKQKDKVKAKQAVLAKLTPEERKLLGVK